MVLKTAIIGMGKMGKIRYNELVQHPGYNIVALSDINSKVANEYPDIDFYTDWEGIKKLNLDCVFVCTYNHIIPEIVEYFLEKGIHVFSEKPPGRNVGDVERMMNAENNSGGKILKFGFNHRFHYGIMEAKSVMDSGKYGRLLWARGIYGKAGGENFVSNWRSNPDLAGGGILLDQGIHMLDLLRYFMGEFTNIKSFVENSYWSEIPLEDNAFAIMKNNEGQVAMLHSSATQWRHKFQLDLYFEEGYMCVNGILSSTRSYGDESVTFAAKQFDPKLGAVGKPREETIYFDRDDSWKFEVEEFYDVISGKKSEFLGTSRDAYYVMKLVHDIYDAGKN